VFQQCTMTISYAYWQKIATSNTVRIQFKCFEYENENKIEKNRIPNDTEMIKCGSLHKIRCETNTVTIE
jgi:hypothetical protein